MAIRLTAEQQSALQVLVLRQYLPDYRQAQVHLIYKPHSPFLYAAHRGKGGVMVESGITFTDSRLHSIMSRAAQAATEILEERTNAVAVRTLRFA